MVSEMVAIELNGDIEISGAEVERRRILEMMEQPERETYAIEIVGEKITQPGLQMFFATLNEAHERGHVLKLGPRANALHWRRTDAGKGDAGK